MNERVQRLLRDFTDLTDASVPGLIQGVYLVGSVALDDFQEQSSDIDCVFLLRSKASPEQLTALADTHKALSERWPRPFLDGLYVTRGDLAAGPDAIPATPAVHEHTFTPVSQYAHDPITWHTLANHGLVVAGTPLAGLDIWYGEHALGDWTLANVRSYWEPWLRSHRRLLSLGGLSMLSDWAISWGVLGVARMSYTLSTGDITSKRGAGEYALTTYGARWHPMINESLRIRRGGPDDHGYVSRFSRRRDALSFMSMVITDLTRA